MRRAGVMPIAPDRRVAGGRASELPGLLMAQLPLPPTWAKTLSAHQLFARPPRASAAFAVKPRPGANTMTVDTLPAEAGPPWLRQRAENWWAQPQYWFRDGLPPAPAAAVAVTALLWPALAGLHSGLQRPASGIWYLLLRKPSFQPPDVAIPIAWTLIDSALAVAAYRLLRRPSDGARNRALALWAVNVGLIGGWSGVFFGGRDLPGSTVLAAAMVGTGAAYVAQARKVDKPAAIAGVPFVGWVAFATVLTAALWRKNRRAVRLGH